MTGTTSMDFGPQLGIVSPTELTFPITIIGAGGIGSPTTLLLAKMGCSNIIVYDHDTVEEHNLPNQLYRLEDCNSPKVVALADIVRAFTGTEIVALQERYEVQDLRGVVIVSVDNMLTRSHVWQKVKYNMDVPLLIDARMGGQIAHVFAVNPISKGQIRSYEEQLFPDEQAVDVPCTERAILYNTFMIASIIGDLIKFHAKRENFPLDGIVKQVDLTQLMLY